MAKYTEETVKSIPNEKIVEELLVTQANNIAIPNKDVSMISKEITGRLVAIKKPCA